CDVVYMLIIHIAQSLSFFVLSFFHIFYFFFFFNDPAPTEIYTLSLHDALPISALFHIGAFQAQHHGQLDVGGLGRLHHAVGQGIDRKSTRLNSSHLVISYAVFCLKKKKKTKKKSYSLYTTN